ncbi:MAG: glycosyl hydrolase family 28-related protein [Brevundimonas sp.]
MSARRNVAAAASALVLGWAASEANAQSTPRSVAGLPPAVTAGRGAAVSFAEHEAEAGIADGRIIGPDRAFGSLAAEAAGRRAVQLTTPGQSVAFIIDAPANALTVRYSTPDAQDCRSGDTHLGLFVDGRRIGRLPLTPCYSWFYGRYPFTNRPADGGGHHVYDHVRMLLPEALPAGASVGLVFEAGTPADWIVVDLADFEWVEEPAPAPLDALSVTAFGADPTGAVDARDAFQRAIAEGRASRRPVWIPPGEYRIDGHVRVDDVTLVGAGPWRSVLRGHGVGVYGRKAAEGGSRNVVLSDFAIIGEVMDRDDRAQLNGIGGAFNQSRLSNLFIQHTKVGVWLDGPMDDVTISGLRILDQAADGLNFHGGVTNAVVEDTFVRNTGDDGLAMWSHPSENHNNVFRRNTVIAPVLANGIAIYGGRDITVSDNLIADTLTQGGGLHLGARFDATPFRGDIVLSGNTVVRGGSMDPNWRFGIGAVWLYALDRPIEGVRIRLRDNHVIDSTDAAVQVIGETIRGVEVDGLRVQGAGAGVFQIRAPGEAVAAGVVADGLGGPAVEDRQPEFRLRDGGGNLGWTVPAGDD